MAGFLFSEPNSSTYSYEKGFEGDDISAGHKEPDLEHVGTRAGAMDSRPRDNLQEMGMMTAHSSFTYHPSAQRPATCK